jgi:hypothetical protein
MGGLISMKGKGGIKLIYESIYRQLEPRVLGMSQTVTKVTVSPQEVYNCYNDISQFARNVSNRELTLVCYGLDKDAPKNRFYLMMLEARIDQLMNTLGQDESCEKVSKSRKLHPYLTSSATPR